MTGDHGGYASPGAFRRALTDRIRSIAETSRWTLAQLQRQVAYDRLLERLYLADDRWVLKGAAALLARDLGMRATIDVDVYRAQAADDAELELRSAASQDIGDWFRFEIGASGPVGDSADGVRLPAVAYVGATAWAQFHIDLFGSDLRMTGQPDAVAPLALLLMPGVEQHGYRAYPLVDHIADKVVATFQLYGSGRRPSTRYKDLVDLVSIVCGVEVKAEQQLVALRSEASRRGVTLPERFDVPDRALWKPGYEAEARRSLLTVGSTLDEALAIVRPFLDPLLKDSAGSVWDPGRRRWTG